MPSLYIVSTPIGNLADMTQRGVDTLRAVAKVLAEDTRRTAILLKHYGISTPLFSAHEHNETARIAQVLSWLADGEDLAIVSDAGTPLLSDPGARIVEAVIDAGYDVVPIPGASALLAALVGSGLDAETFTFLGFLPRSGRERKERLAEIAALTRTSVLYEAPGRVFKLLDDLIALAGENRRVVVARELTKIHETFVRGTLAEVRAYYENQDVRGEVVVMVAAADPVPAEASEEAARAIAVEMLATGTSVRDTAKEITKVTGMARNRAYELARTLSEEAVDPS